METQTETKTEKKIYVDPATYKTLEFLANNKNMTIREYTDFLFKRVTTVFSDPDPNDPSIEVPLTPEQYAKLKTWLDAKDDIDVCTDGESKAVLLNERELWHKNHAGEKEVLGGEMIQLRTPIFSPFLDFIREYLSFFGDKQTPETFCMQAVYDKCNTLHSDLTQFAKNKVHLLDSDAWYEKHSHLAITSTQPEAKLNSKNPASPSFFRLVKCFLRELTCEESAQVPIFLSVDKNVLQYIVQKTV